MKTLNFGSLNIDYVYSVASIVRPGETVKAVKHEKYCGGKGLNQSVALARAGADVYHAGVIGKDGEFLLEAMKESRVNTQYTCVSSCDSGHAIIQVDKNGQNSIIIYPGSNHLITEQMIDDVLSNFVQDDWLLLQNEINNIELIINKAFEKGMKIALNPSPINDTVFSLPLEKISLFFLNEIEGNAITGKENCDEICSALLQKYVNSSVVLTLGSKGAVFADKTTRKFQPAMKTSVADTTAAGDTFTGYFLQSYINGNLPDEALLRATAAAAVSVSRNGAVSSIPYAGEVTEMLHNCLNQTNG